MKYYEKYIGSITVQEFVRPFKYLVDPVESAIHSFARTWPWNEAIPEDFYTEVYAYCEEQLNG